MKISCLQTVPKETINEALDEAVDLASFAIKNGSKFLFLPEYCGGIYSNGKFHQPCLSLLFCNQARKYSQQVRSINFTYNEYFEALL